MWSGQMTKILINLDLIEIIQFCLKIMICRDTPTHGCVGGWVVGWVGQWVWSGQMTKILINLDLIEIIQFCLKICRDTHTHTPPMGGWLGGSVGQSVGLGQLTNN